MDFSPTESQSILRRSVREFAERTLAPHVMEWDEAQRFPVELLPDLATLGFAGHSGASRVRRRGDVGRRVLHLHRGARAG